MKDRANPKEAQYLLRFDDLCPTMDRAGWQRFLPLLRRFAIQPILAVIPDNQDVQLQVNDPDPAFWEQMRALQAAGATIGLHGYEHLCLSEGRSLIPLHRQTEFAGAPEVYQRRWIRTGVGILRANGLEPRIWVAPRHGSDRTTLRVLQDEGIGLVSDGFALGPYCSRGVTWIPQQLWAPVPKRRGLWTICIHPATASKESLIQLEKFLTRFAAKFTSVDRVLGEWTARPRGMPDRLFHAHMMTRLYRSRLRRWMQAS